IVVLHRRGARILLDCDAIRLAFGNGMQLTVVVENQIPFAGGDRHFTGADNRRLPSSESPVAGTEDACWSFDLELSGRRRDQRRASASQDYVRETGVRPEGRYARRREVDLPGPDAQAQRTPGICLERVARVNSAASRTFRGALARVLRLNHHSEML